MFLHEEEGTADVFKQESSINGLFFHQHLGVVDFYSLRLGVGLMMLQVAGNKK